MSEDFDKSDFDKGDTSVPNAADELRIVARRRRQLTSSHTVDDEVLTEIIQFLEDEASRGLFQTRIYLRSDPVRSRDSQRKQTSANDEEIAIILKLEEMGFEATSIGTIPKGSTPNANFSYTYQNISRWSTISRNPLFGGHNDPEGMAGTVRRRGNIRGWIISWK